MSLPARVPRCRARRGRRAGSVGDGIDERSLGVSIRCVTKALRVNSLQESSRSFHSGNLANCRIDRCTVSSTRNRRPRIGDRAADGVERADQVDARGVLGRVGQPGDLQSELDPQLLDQAVVRRGCAGLVDGQRVALTAVRRRERYRHQHQRRPKLAIIEAASSACRTRGTDCWRRSPRRSSLPCMARYRSLRLVRRVGDVDVGAALVGQQQFTLALGQVTPKPDAARIVDVLDRVGREQGDAWPWR